MDRGKSPSDQQENIGKYVLEKTSFVHCVHITTPFEGVTERVLSNYLPCLMSFVSV